MTERTVTRPDTKWFANELAAIAGELMSIDAETKRLKARKAHLQKVQRALCEVCDLSGTPGLQNAVPPVRAHKKYGGRGQLREWLKDTLQAAAPGAVDSPTLVRLAEVRFGLTLATGKERDRWRRNTLTRQLRCLLSEDQVERMHDVKAAAGSVGVWRWKLAPSLKQLAALQGQERG